METLSVELFFRLLATDAHIAHANEDLRYKQFAFMQLIPNATGCGAIAPPMWMAGRHLDDDIACNVARGFVELAFAELLSDRFSVALVRVALDRLSSKDLLASIVCTASSDALMAQLDSIDGVRAFAERCKQVSPDGRGEATGGIERVAGLTGELNATLDAIAAWDNREGLVSRVAALLMVARELATKPRIIWTSRATGAPVSDANALRQFIREHQPSAHVAVEGIEPPEPQEGRAVYWIVDGHIVQFSVTDDELKCGAKLFIENFKTLESEMGFRVSTRREYVKRRTEQPAALLEGALDSVARQHLRWFMESIRCNVTSADAACFGAQHMGFLILAIVFIGKEVLYGFCFDGEKMAGSAFGAWCEANLNGALFDDATKKIFEKIASARATGRKHIARPRALSPKTVLLGLRDSFRHPEVFLRVDAGGVTSAANFAANVIGLVVRSIEQGAQVLMALNDCAFFRCCISDFLADYSILFPEAFGDFCKRTEAVA